MTALGLMGPAHENRRDSPDLTSLEICFPVGQGFPRRLRFGSSEGAESGPSREPGLEQWQAVGVGLRAGGLVPPRA